jgi:iron(III) transport system substrate-binding protein
MKTRAKALAGIALAATTALGLAACGNGTASPAAAGSASGDNKVAGEITVYNAQHDTLTKEWVDAFTKETGVKVTVRQGSDTELSNQIVQEGAASPADVFLTENSPAMAQVENAGLFADVD